MRAKLDENVPVEAAELLRAAGWTCDTVHDEGLGGAEDPEIGTACRTERRVLFTLDLDFANPFSYPPEAFPGIVVLRIPSKGTVDDIEAALRALLAHATQAVLSGHLMIAESSGRVRVYRPD